MKLLLKYLFLFCCGGIVYYLMEIVWRGGYSYFASFIMGGACFIALGLLNEYIDWEMSMIEQMFLGMMSITFIEFVSGFIINIKLGLNQWDYSSIPFNFMGQICLPYMVLWFFLSPVGIVLDDYLRYWFFKEKKPKYSLF